MNLKPIMMTQEQWAEHDRQNEAIRVAEAAASGRPNALSWQLDRMKLGSPSLEIDPQGLLTIKINGNSHQMTIEEWHKRGEYGKEDSKAAIKESLTTPVTATQARQDALQTVLPPHPTLESLKPANKVGRTPKAQQTASV